MTAYLSASMSIINPLWIVIVVTYAMRRYICCRCIHTLLPLRSILLIDHVYLLVCHLQVNGVVVHCKQELMDIMETKVIVSNSHSYTVHWAITIMLKMEPVPFKVGKVFFMYTNLTVCSRLHS